jgi:outer membrane protein assembly factor BamD (BamD/ComL family)
VSNLPSPVPPGTSSSPTFTPTAPSGISDTNEERALVDRARTALARGLASDALAAIDQHTKRFPRGRLAEEREALAVQALALSGDKNAAGARAARFRRSFPSSIFASAVDQAVGSR